MGPEALTPEEALQGAAQGRGQESRVAGGAPSAGGLGGGVLQDVVGVALKPLGTLKRQQRGALKANKDLELGGGPRVALLGQGEDSAEAVDPPRVAHGHEEERGLGRAEEQVPAARDGGLRGRECERVAGSPPKGGASPVHMPRHLIEQDN